MVELLAWLLGLSCDADVTHVLAVLLAGAYNWHVDCQPATSAHSCDAAGIPECAVAAAGAVSRAVASVCAAYPSCSTLLRVLVVDACCFLEESTQTNECQAASVGQVSL